MFGLSFSSIIVSCASFELRSDTMLPLPRRQLGRYGPEVSALGFGAMGLSASYGKVEENEARFAVLDRALQLGSTFWDTSDVCVYTLVRCRSSSSF
jgi:hypothetical protein